jgi:hypothetical protein
MGGGNWSNDDYIKRNVSRAKSNTTTFNYNDNIRKGVITTKVHDSLNPHGVVREARDSTEHPNSLPIAVVLDVTGSMSEVPVMIQKNFPKLMGLLLDGHVKDPQVVFSATGDAHSDLVPLQVGQFESDIRIEDNVINMYLEGGGGGQNKETYELAMYFFTHRVVTDAWEKRHKKGYLFFIGDELPYSTIYANHIKDIIGAKEDNDIVTEELIKQLLEKWNVFVILPKMTNNYGQKWLHEGWKKLFGNEHVLDLDNPNGICELISTTVKLCEGALDEDTISSDLAASGLQVSDSVTKALNPLMKSTALVPVVQSNALAQHTPRKPTQRL